MNEEIAKNLHNAAEVWGIDITRTEITDIEVDEATKVAQRQQLNAERKRRATIAEAEGDKRSIELKAEAELFRAQKDADAYAIKVKAEADAEQTTLLATAISKNGMPAIEFEISRRQVEASSELASSSNSKTLILPSNITEAIGGLTTILKTIK
jgi:regulator of protease activity HflC (stomatin/prohibitin superfamily)